MTGHWNSESGQWKWVAAHWELPPSRSAVWVGGHWISQAGTWVWSNGTWDVPNAAQTQAGPPQPPNQASPSNGQVAVTGNQAVPMPSTPAPYMYGEYGPGGVDRAIDQQPATTDYGPAYDYEPDYPGYAYAWNYDPWYWGGYPWGFIGGMGLGYWGGYGHWGHGGFHGQGGGRGGFSGHAGGGHFGNGGHFGSGGHFGGGHSH
jgi:hypothetical protein